MFLVFPSVNSYAGETWMTFECIKGPYYNSEGAVLPDATRRIVYSNEHGKATFGGEWICPEIDGIIEKHRAESFYLVRVSGNKGYVNSLEHRNNPISKPATRINVKPHKMLRFRFGDFNIQILTNDEAMTIKENIFKIKPESGVTQ